MAWRRGRPGRGCNPVRPVTGSTSAWVSRPSNRGIPGFPRPDGKRAGEDLSHAQSSLPICAARARAVREVVRRRTGCSARFRHAGRGKPRHPIHDCRPTPLSPRSRGTDLAMIVRWCVGVRRNGSWFKGGRNTVQDQKGSRSTNGIRTMCPVPEILGHCHRAEASGDPPHLRTGLHPAGSPLPWPSGSHGKDHLCQDSKRPRAHLATSRFLGSRGIP